MQINCKNMSIDKALRLLRKKVEADGLLQELKSREYYEKPSKIHQHKSLIFLSPLIPESSDSDDRQGGAGIGDW
jgi:ribosomal protein S21